QDQTLQRKLISLINADTEGVQALALRFVQFSRNKHLTVLSLKQLFYVSITSFSMSTAFFVSHRCQTSSSISDAF
ncbi:hypothetical protein ABEV40_05220, partial [Geobacillus thermocatenulatus]